MISDPLYLLFDDLQCYLSVRSAVEGDVHDRVDRRAADHGGQKHEVIDSYRKSSYYRIFDHSVGSDGA